MSHPNGESYYTNLGRNAILQTTPDFKAFNEALNEALLSEEDDDRQEAKSQVYEGGVVAAALRKGDNEQTARSVIEKIFTADVQESHSGIPLSSFKEGFRVAFLTGNFTVALLLIEYMSRYDNLIPRLYYGEAFIECLDRIISGVAYPFQNFIVETLPKDTIQIILSIFRVLLEKINQMLIHTTRDERLLKVIDRIAYIRAGGNKNSDALKALLSILLQYVILPVPPPKGSDDPYKEERKIWSAVRGVKAMTINRVAAPDVAGIIKNFTYGLPQRFCAKCNKGVKEAVV